MTERDIIKLLKSWADPKNVAGMVRFGISAKGALGFPVPKLRALAKKTGKDHALALKLWNSGLHEGRILATMIADPAVMTAKEADAWVSDFDSWDTCDQACMNVLRYAPFAWNKILVWSKSKEEFVRRAGFAMIAALASGDKKATDAQFIKLFPLIKKYSTDERNFVKKAVNWALRGIGKRNIKLNALVVKAARDIVKIDSKSARWIANDAIRELTDPKTIKMVRVRR
jgi:3-methyladenine DNA glycosylase AlkD